MSTRVRRQEESGYALLFVFVMAAAVAIGLYMEMPRVAFESQRAREQLLVDRGSQYRRAIQLFYRKFGRYPASMDDLETTNNVRFLRHKYKDPMTGKDDWRIIHMGPGGYLTDSLVQKAPDPTQTDKSKPTSGDASSVTGVSDPNAVNQGLNLAAVRRPSDLMAGGAPGAAPANPNDPNAPQQPPAGLQPGQIQTGQLQPGQLQPGQLQPGQLPPGQLQPSQVQPGQPYPFQPQPGQLQSGLTPNGVPPDPNNPQPLPTPPVAYDPNQPGAVPPPGFVVGRGGFVPVPTAPQNGGLVPGQAVPGQQFNNAQPGLPGAGANQATSMINNILRSPQTPPSGLTGASTTTGGGTGIAGVASKYQGVGIKVINERTKYKEWEFVYDFKNDRSRTGLATGAVPQAGAQASPTATPAAPVTPNPTTTH